MRADAAAAVDAAALDTACCSIAARPTRLVSRSEPFIVAAASPLSRSSVHRTHESLSVLFHSLTHSLSRFHHGPAPSVPPPRTPSPLPFCPLPPGRPRAPPPY